MLLPRFDYLRPKNLDEACRMLAERGESAALIAGGTDLVVKMKHGQVHPTAVISLASLRRARPLERSSSGAVAIDPLATMNEVAGAPELAPGTTGSSGAPARDLCSIAEGARAVGSPQIRNRATIGGNLASARPCADTAPPLVSWQARVRLTSPHDRREVDLESFFTGPGQTLRRADEVLTDILVDPPPPDSGGAFLKLIRRAALEVTIVSVAARVTLDGPGGPVSKARIVLGSVAPTPLRAREAEQGLRGNPLDEETIHQAAVRARDASRPIDDLRASADYRRQMVEVLVRRTLREAGRRAGATP